MCNGLIGKKLGMTGFFLRDGGYVAATVVHAGPCIITQIKTQLSDRYDALQLGFGKKKKFRVNKPLIGHLKKSGDECFEALAEVDVDTPDMYKLGQTIDLDLFKIGERVDVVGVTKGRGFAGVIKRHGFHGGSKTHGSHCHRIPGSIGCSAWPAKVARGKKMPGHYGNEQKTAQNLEIVDINLEKNLILLKGAVPGFRSGIVTIKKLNSQKNKSNELK